MERILRIASLYTASYTLQTLQTNGENPQNKSRKISETPKVGLQHVLPFYPFIIGIYKEMHWFLLWPAFTPKNPQNEFDENPRKSVTMRNALNSQSSTLYIY